VVLVLGGTVDADRIADRKVRPFAAVGASDRFGDVVKLHRWIGSSAKIGSRQRLWEGWRYGTEERVAQRVAAVGVALDILCFVLRIRAGDLRVCRPGIAVEEQAAIFVGDRDPLDVEECRGVVGDRHAGIARGDPLAAAAQFVATRKDAASRYED